MAKNNELNLSKNVFGLGVTGDGAVAYPDGGGCGGCAGSCFGTGGPRPKDFFPWAMNQSGQDNLDFLNDEENIIL